jgi:hypothetical protein
MISRAVPIADDTWKLVDEAGHTLGRIIAPRIRLDKTPPDDTVYLERRQPGKDPGPSRKERRRPESNR